MLRDNDFDNPSLLFQHRDELGQSSELHSVSSRQQRCEDEGKLVVVGTHYSYRQKEIKTEMVGNWNSL